MAEEKALVKYTARDGQEISLGFEIIRTYLVAGKKELVTPQELMFFMGLCKSRGLNPFKKDAYLIKYSQDPAAIVTSIDFYRGRARAQKDCRGWKSGIIVLAKPGEIVEREGEIILEGETLLGGWFEAKPEGWEYPLKHTVNLKPYVKKKSDGSVTRFWQEDNQPSQIRKVAESQGLRRAWPDEFQGMYGEEEMLTPSMDPDGGMGEAQRAAEKAKDDAIKKFNDSVPEGAPHLNEFLDLTAKANRQDIDALKVSCSDDLENFWAAYRKWEAKKYPKEPTAGDPATQTEPGTVANGSTVPTEEKTKTAIERAMELESDHPSLFKEACKREQASRPFSEAVALIVVNRAKTMTDAGWKEDSKEKKR